MGVTRGDAVSQQYINALQDSFSMLRDKSGTVREKALALGNHTENHC